LTHKLDIIEQHYIEFLAHKKIILSARFNFFLQLNQQEFILKGCHITEEA